MVNQVLHIYIPGIFLRSLMWILGHIPSNDIEENDKADFAHLFCAITSVSFNCTNKAHLLSVILVTI